MTVIRGFVKLFAAGSLLLLATLTFGQSKAEKRKKIEELIVAFEKDIPAPTVSAQQLKEWQAKKDEIIVVDVRTKVERKPSMIDGAISKEEFEKNKSRYKGKMVIPYCTIGYRSAKYTQELVKQGYKARNLRGSILLWMHENGKLVDANGKATKQVHVYGKAWDLAPDGYTSITTKPK